MPTYIHRGTKRVHRSTSPASLPEPVADYIREPDLTAVDGHPERHWLIAGDDVLLMDQAARDAVDAALDTTRLDQIADELERNETIMRGFAEVVLDQINELRADHQRAPFTLRQLRNAVRSKL